MKALDDWMVAMATVDRLMALIRGVMGGVITEREFIDAVRAQADLLGVEVGR